MRTNIEIDDGLLNSAMSATGLPTKKATVEEGLRVLVRLHRQVDALKDLAGIGWQGNLGRIREGRRVRKAK